VAPRQTGNGSVTISDWTQTGRYAAGLDTPATGSEFRRADCAPRASLGDGRLTIGDWTQAGRYAAGLDPIAAASGPVAPSGQLAASGEQRGSNAPRTTGEGARTIRLDRASADLLIVECDARGDENAFGFSLKFDPALWRFVSASVGRDANGSSLYVNSTQAARGRVGFALALEAGASLPAGARQIAIARFQSLSGRGAGAIEFGDLPVRREAVDARANSLPVTFPRQRERRNEIGSPHRPKNFRRRHPFSTRFTH
ncbi:MAG: cohesin domain-containing protein, partial [Blastocatellia bacterium]